MFRSDPLPLPKSSGFIYFTTKPITKPPHLSHDGSYIVMTMPASLLSDLLSILRNERNLTIRFFDPESPGVAPSAFLETGRGHARSRSRSDAIGGRDVKSEHPNLDLLDPKLTPFFKNAMS
jgi:hypothetical protein